MKPIGRKLLAWKRQKKKAVSTAMESDFAIDTLTGHVWVPMDVTSRTEKFPLIIFSHGWAGSGRQSIFLCRALAEAGYIVVAPNHADAMAGRDIEAMKKDPYWQPEAIKQRIRNSFEPSVAAEGKMQDMAFPHFFDFDQWKETSSRNRADNVEAVLEWALHDAPWASKVDADRVGLVGHSLGGYTTLGLVGAWPSWTDVRFKCVVAQAPYTNPFLVHKTLPQIRVPVMLQVGRLDPYIFGYLTDPAGSYDQLPPLPKYLLVLDKGTHYAFTDAGLLYHEAITRYTVAFLDRHLRGLDAHSILDKSGSPMATLMCKKL